MADTRELILARLKAVCEGIEGVSAVERNRLDVSGLSRPAIIIHDGGESELARSSGNTAAPRALKFSAQQWNTMAPELHIHLHAAAAASGELYGLYRNRVLLAVLNDTTLRGLVGSNGNIVFSSFSVNPPAPEGRERRAELNFDFTYLFRLSDLGS